MVIDDYCSCLLRGPNEFGFDKLDSSRETKISGHNENSERR